MSYFWDFSNGGDVKSTDTGGSLTGWTGGGLLDSFAGSSVSADPNGAYNWFSPEVGGALNQSLGMDAGALVARGASFLGGVGNWWGGLQPGTQGLLSSLASGAAGAYLQGRQYDKQRDAERAMRREDREALARMREVPSAAQVGTNGGHKWN